MDFYMAGMNVFLLLSWKIMNSLPDKYFDNSFFEWLSLAWQFASITYWTWRFLNIDISQGSVAIYLRCGEMLNTNLLQIYYGV